jgi:hypothetical protein
MNSIKCPQCGLVSFATGSACKGCNYQFPVTVYTVVKPAGQLPSGQTTSEAGQTPSFEPLPEFEPEAAPIGGWLIVFLLYLGLLLALAIYWIQKYVNMFSDEAFHQLTSEGSRLYVPGLGAGATFEFIWLSIVAVGCILLLLRFFRKSYSFRRLAISILSVKIAFAFLDYLMALNASNQIEEKLTAILGKAKVHELLPSYTGLLVLASIVISAMWLGYFLQSRRVESTFIY